MFVCAQVAVLLGTGLQHRDVDSVAAELDIPVSQVLAFFNKTIRKIATSLREMVEAHVSSEMAGGKGSTAVQVEMRKRVKGMDSMDHSLAEEQRKDTKAFNQKQREVLMAHKDLSKHAVAPEVVAAMDEELSRLGSGLRGKGAVPKVLSVPVASAKASQLLPEEQVGEHAEKVVVVVGEQASTPHVGKKSKKEKGKGDALGTPAPISSTSSSSSSSHAMDQTHEAVAEDLENIKKEKRKSDAAFADEAGAEAGSVEEEEGPGAEGGKKKKKKKKKAGASD